MIVDRMHSWLEDLAEAGIDLDEYGRLEAEAASDSATQQEAVVNSVVKQNPKTGQWVINTPRGQILVLFRYGPRPEDWTLEWDFLDEQFAGDFWDMIERLPPMPGTWQDYDDDGNGLHNWPGDISWDIPWAVMSCWITNDSIVVYS